MRAAEELELRRPRRIRLDDLDRPGRRIGTHPLSAIGIVVEVAGDLLGRGHRVRA